MNAMAKYKTYYGRRRRWLKLVAAVLVLAAIAALCVFVLPGFVVYTENGAYFDLSFLPWMSIPSSPTPSPTPTTSVVIILPSPSPSPNPTPPPAPVRPPDPKGYYVSLIDALDASKLAAAKAAALANGANMITLEYKDQQGTVLGADSAREMLAALRGDGLDVAALISVCIDNTIPLGVNTAWAVKHTSGQNFWDANKNRWISLYAPEAREFLIKTVRDALDAGFDRVILHNIGFPYEGGLSQIRYGADHDPVGTVNLFLDELSAACGENAPIDAFILDGAISEGVFETAGHELAAFEKTFDRLYVLLPEDTMSVDERFLPVIQVSDSQLEAKIDAAGQGYLVFGMP